MPEPMPGVYTHFKGNRYELLYVATHSETQEAMVVYRALYGEGGVWVRPLSMWDEVVTREGKRYRRFAPEGEGNALPDIPVPDQREKLEALMRVFGYGAFRAGQEPLIDAVLSGRDALGVMPTGSGKSLCYQLPALMRPGSALVVSPLISLMKDQVSAMTQAGVSAAYLNSSLTPRQFDTALARAAQGRYKIMYVAPERLLTERFLEVARALTLSLVAVDEAHCLSQWGQDFRPSYLDIPDFIDALGTRPQVCAFTATATARVQEDIARLLRLRDPLVVTTGFDRPNLYLEVITPKKKDRTLMALMKKYEGESGIVYCATRKNVEKVYDLLRDMGLPVVRYHAGLSDEERRTSQEDFAFDRAQVIVATNAFGMGIDKSNVRFVVHYNMPKDVESYYQEAGRAGRDGEAADCVLLYGRQDIMTQRLLIDKSRDMSGLHGAQAASVRSASLYRLNQMIAYCEGKGCLRAAILHYFGDTAVGACGHCSVCAPRDRLEDLPAPARKKQRDESSTHAPARNSQRYESDDPAFDALRALRMRVAASRGVPAYVVFTDATLRAMCAMRPCTLEDMRAVPGVGDAKLEAYGETFLQALNQMQH